MCWRGKFAEEIFFPKSSKLVCRLFRFCKVKLMESDFFFELFELYIMFKMTKNFPFVPILALKMLICQIFINKQVWFFLSGLVDYFDSGRIVDRFW